MRYFSTLRYLIISLVLLCSACGTALPTVKPYKLDVQQGNVVTSKMLLQLRPGMTKSQVRFIMGTPLIQDSFHGNRWDYVYQMREGGKVTEQRRVILDFENELLKTVRGDVIPAGSDPVKSDESKAQTGTRVVEPYKKPQEKGLISKLKFWEKDEAALAKEAAEKEVLAKTAVKSEVQAEVVAKKAEVAVESSAVSAGAASPEEPKSLLAIPLEATPLNAAPADATPVIVAPVVASAPPALPNATTVASPAVIDASKSDIAPAEQALASPDSVEKPVVAIQPVAEPIPVPAKVPVYESSSGMIFDKNLRSVPDEPETVVKAEAVAPRVGNKVIPKPKDLPAESEPGFFDRMLEKIGF